MPSEPESTAYETVDARLTSPNTNPEPLTAEAGAAVPVFKDRRSGSRSGPGAERRQFANTYSTLSPEARELGLAIDEYKFRNHRRFIGYEELLAVIRSLGYHK